MSQEFTCNQKTFSNTDSIDNYLTLTIIILNSLLLLFFLVKMCKLCSYAFSYSNYHIHETYKLYALCIINIMAAILVRKTQVDLKDYNAINQGNVPGTDSNLIGYYIINDLFGIISILTNNILLLFNAFNWLAIAKNCDFTERDDSNFVQLDEVENLSHEESIIKISQNNDRKKLHYAKVYFLYCFLPMLLILSIVGTLNHHQNDSWCIIINISIIVSSLIPLVVFGFAFALFLKKFSDSDVAKKTKIGLVFLLFSIITRGIFYLIFLIKKDDVQNSGNVLTLIYTVVCNLAPMLVMVLLSEVQLHKQQHDLMHRSTGLIFKSTII